MTLFVPNYCAIMASGLSKTEGACLRIDYCDEHVIQENSYISGAIPLTHTYYTSYESQYFSVLDHTSNI